MMKLNNNTIKEIYNDLNELASIELQRSLWYCFNENQKSSSFVELFERLFDDHKVEFFVGYQMEDFNPSLELRKGMNDLVEALNKYDERDGSHDFILQDPNWMTISSQAKEVLRMWDSNSELALVLKSA